MKRLVNNSKNSIFVIILCPGDLAYEHIYCTPPGAIRRDEAGDGSIFEDQAGDASMFEVDAPSDEPLDLLTFGF